MLLNDYSNLLKYEEKVIPLWTSEYQEEVNKNTIKKQLINKN